MVILYNINAFIIYKYNTPLNQMTTPLAIKPSRPPLVYNFYHTCVYYKCHKTCEDDADIKKQKGLPNDELESNRHFVTTAYQLDMLSAFRVPETNDCIAEADAVSKNMDDLYEHLKTSKICRELMVLAAAHLKSDDMRKGLAVLYSFQYMHFMHLAVALSFVFALETYVSTNNLTSLNKPIDQIDINIGDAFDAAVNHKGFVEQIEIFKKMLQV